MKKLLIIAILSVVGIAANAASFKWSGANIYGPDGNKFSGTAELFCDALSSTALSSATVTSGAIAATSFDNSTAVGDKSYNFYFKITTTYGGNEVSYTSAVKSVTALETGTATIGFGNQESATKADGAWGTAAVPEPTSGLLMLLGMAGLALRRRRV